MVKGIVYASIGVRHERESKNSSSQILGDCLASKED